MRLLQRLKLQVDILHSPQSAQLSPVGISHLRLTHDHTHTRPRRRADMPLMEKVVESKTNGTTNVTKQTNLFTSIKALFILQFDRLH